MFRQTSVIIFCVHLIIIVILVSSCDSKNSNGQSNNLPGSSGIHLADHNSTKSQEISKECSGSEGCSKSDQTATIANNVASNTAGSANLSLNKRRGFVNYMFPEPMSNSLLNSGFQPEFAQYPSISRSAVNGHWIFPQNRALAGLHAGPRHPDHFALSLYPAESVPRFSYSKFVQDAGIGQTSPDGSPINETHSSANNASLYGEYGRRHSASGKTHGSKGQSRSDQSTVSESKQVDSPQPTASTSPSTGHSAERSSQGPLVPITSQGLRPRSKPLPAPRAFRSKYEYLNTLPSSGMKRYETGFPMPRPMNAFGPRPGRGPRPFRGPRPPFGRARPGPPFGLSMKSLSMPIGGSFKSSPMSPSIWDEMAPASPILDPMGSPAAAASSLLDPIGPAASAGLSPSLASQAYPLALGSSIDSYPLVGGPNPMPPFHLGPDGPGFPPNGPGGMSFPGGQHQHMMGPMPAGSQTQGSASASSLEQLKKAHPGLHPEQYKYLEQWYNYLNQPMIKSYFDSFRDPSGEPITSSEKNNQKSDSNSGKDQGRPWFRNLKLPSLNMNRLQIPKVRDIFKNFRSGLGGGSGSTTTTTTESSNESSF